MRIVKISDARGFTLIEILIAFSIVAVIISIIYTSYTGAISISQNTESKAAIYSMARTALERIHEDLESMYISNKPENTGGTTPQQKKTEKDYDLFIGETHELKGERNDSLRFSSKAHVSFEDDQFLPISEINYIVKESSDGETLILYRSDTPQFGMTAENEQDELILCKNLVSIKFTYLDSEKNEYETWDSSEKGSDFKFPVMVSIELKLINPDPDEEPVMFKTSVAIPMGKKLYGKTT